MGVGWVDIILTWLFVLIGFIMTFFILLQEGKGGGLAALGGTKAAGVEGVTNPIRRATAYLAGLFFILAVILGIMHKPKEGTRIGDETADATAATKKADETKKPDEPKKVEPEKKADEKKPDEKKADEKKPAEGAKPDEIKTGDA